VTRAGLAWRGYAFVAALLAALGVGHWLGAVALRGPVLYGEGVVANAAFLARDRLEYTAGAHWGPDVPLFTAANYPPLFFHLVSFGDPFVTGRVLSIAGTLFVAGAIAWRARPAGPLVAGTLALAWLGSVPVLQWGSALKPDLVALAFTVAAVMALDRAGPRHTLAGALIGVAAMAKPTALLPALAMLVFVGRRDPLAAARAAASGTVAALAVAFVTHGPEGGALTHVIDWNALPWRLELALPLALLALIVLAVPIATVALTRPSTTIVTAYAAGAVGVLLLGGREGATINYFLDLSAAIALALAGRAPLLASSVRYPLAAFAQAAVAVLLLNPFGVVPGRAAGAGAWGDPARIDAVVAIEGTLLVEDAGLLVAVGRQPLVDDLFLWSRNRSREDAGQLSFPEGDALIAAVRAGRFDGVVSEADLATLDVVGGFERQRWHPDLVAAVLERYTLRPTSGPAEHPLFVYTRR
jgi:Glycosyltransferase family 87